MEHISKFYRFKDAISYGKKRSDAFADELILFARPKNGGMAFIAREEFCDNMIVRATTVEGGYSIQTGHATYPCPSDIFERYFEEYKPMVFRD